MESLLSLHRAEVLRHCYRMMGCYADAEDLTQDALLRAWEARDAFRGEGSLRSWLLAIATNTCLNALERRKRLELPQLERPPAGPGTPPVELEPARWLTPAPDARLFPGPEESAERRETVALAFLAALQHLSPKQRAALLLKDVVGLSAEEIAGALALSIPSVNSALHRAREALRELPPTPPSEEPPPEALAGYVRAWEERDLDALAALLREEVTLAMPPHGVWFRGRDVVVDFFRRPRFQEFWQAGVRVGLTRANGEPALGFYANLYGGGLHSVGVTRFVGGKVAEMTVFIGPRFLAGFDLVGDSAQFPEPSLS